MSQPLAQLHFYLIRGLIREARHWGSLPTLLNEALPAAQVTCLDIPGAGRHFRHQSPLSVDGMVRAMRAEFLARKQDGEIAVVVAISLGGMITAHWLRAFPADFQGAVIINSSYGGLSPLHHRLQPAALVHMLRVAMAPTQRKEAEILRMVSNHADAFEGALSMWQSIRQESPVSASNSVRQLLAAARFRLNGWTPAIPVLVLASTRDRMVSVECSRAIANAWHATLVEHPSAGHDVSVDDPHWIAQQVLAFLSAKGFI